MELFIKGKLTYPCTLKWIQRGSYDDEKKEFIYKDAKALYNGNSLPRLIAILMECRTATNIKDMEIKWK